MVTNKIADAINSRNKKVFIAATGGGSGWAESFLRWGGGSQTLVGFYVPYATEMTQDFTGGVREKFVSSSTARQLAMSSYLKCLKASDKPKDAFGIGVTATIRRVGKDRVGRLYQVYAAIQTEKYTTSYYLNLGRDARAVQENKINKLITFILADNFGCAVNLDPRIETVGIECHSAQSSMGGYSVFDNNWVRPCRGMKDGDIILSGSFNPMHDYHMLMLGSASTLMGSNGFYELSVTNYEKPPLDYQEIHNRNKNNNLILTNLPRFREKLIHFPNQYFAMGTDTFDRLSLSDREYFKTGQIILFNRDKTPVDFNHIVDYCDAVNNQSRQFVGFTNNVSSSQIRNT